MKRYLIVVEPTKTGYSAYFPDLDGCVATGATLLQVQKNMQAAIEFHLQGLKLAKIRIPPPRATIAFAEVSA